MKIAIVVVGYNRPDSIEQLLTSIVKAEYEGDIVDLVISLDKGNRQTEIIAAANIFEWPYGEKIIRAFPERQGLRRHIIQCGDLTNQYDAVIVLEDDLLVSRWYYSYVKQAIDFYQDDERIAGISLYKHQTHPGVYRPFEPVNNGYDAFMMQFAMSWGQCWTKNMWSGFKKWYIKKQGKDIESGDSLPLYVAGWNNQSWLKYYMKYIVETDKYFIYPYYALSTNASDVGEHCKIPNNDFQVALMEGKLKYRFPIFESAIKYDVYFERMNLKMFPELKGKKVLDLYGNRNTYGDADYVISTKELPYKKVRSIQLKYRPIEVNCIQPVNGNGISIYDIRNKSAVSKLNTDIVTRYDVRAIHWKKLLHLGWIGFIEAIESRMRRK